MKLKPTLIVLACIIAIQTYGQSELISELNKNITKIESVTPDGNFNDLNSLQSVFQDKEIIGLGEATHGTHEFFTYKHRMVKYLVKNENFKVFIIEGDFAGSQAMNEYVVHGKGTLMDGLKGIGYGVWFRKEFVDFVEWIKEYNQDKPIEDKVKFYGCDINNEVSVAQRLKSFLGENNRLNNSLNEGLEIIIQRQLRKKLSEENSTYAEEVISELSDAFTSIKECRKKILMQQCKRELEQIFEIIQADDKTSIVLRDKFMAENIEWVYNHENMQKTVFWAHNEHIKNDKAKSYQKPTGYYLKERFGDNYYSFGFGFYDGEVAGYNWKEKKYDSFKVPAMSSKKLTDAVFSECIYPNFILDLRTTNSNDIISKFFNANLYQRTIGAGFHPDGKKQNHFRMGKLIDKYDGLIFFRETNPSRVIEKTA